MYLYCINCRKYVVAQKFNVYKNLLKTEIMSKEYYCPNCLETIYIKKENREK